MAKEHVPDRAGKGARGVKAVPVARAARVVKVVREGPVAQAGKVEQVRPEAKVEQADRAAAPLLPRLSRRTLPWA